MTVAPWPSPLDFFARLKWIDGRPLMDTIEPYRREIFVKALHTFRPDGTPQYNQVVRGSGKKNNKSTDLTLAGLFKLLIPETVQGNDAFILANDEDQAGDDLDLCKKLIAVNPVLAAELWVLDKEIRRRDGRGTFRVLPAKNVAGNHGKTAGFLGYDEVHSQKNYDLFEALAPDPTRTDVLVWITSYDTVFNSPGVPLFDLKQAGREGTDPRMLFVWYSGDYCTDPNFAKLEPELRANPSIASWPDGRAYLDQQRRRLPTHKFRRLHLNLPGSPNGAFLDQGVVLSAIVKGRRSLPPRAERDHVAFVDMSGGSSDDACLAIGHKDGGKVVIDLVAKQDAVPPFNPRTAVRRFVGLLKKFSCSSVVGDAYAGETFRQDFRDEGISYHVSPQSKTELYEALEPALNAGEVELPDIPILTEQLLTLVVKGTKIDHQASTDHDDHANAVAGVVAQFHNADWSGSRGFFELMRQTHGGALVSGYWSDRARSKNDEPTPVTKEWAKGSIEYSKWMAGEIGPPM